MASSYMSIHLDHSLLAIENGRYYSYEEKKVLDVILTLRTLKFFLDNNYGKHKPLVSNMSC